MNWLYIQEKNERDASTRAAWERRHHLKRSTKEEKDRKLRQTYGMTRDQLALQANTRREQWAMNALTDPSVDLEQPSESSFHSHTFRDRLPQMELGVDSHFSSRKYVPRAHFKGGGKLDKRKSREFRELPETDQRRVVNGMYPAASTSSFTDIGTLRGRVEQPVYDEKSVGATMRAREPAKELHPPMHFRAKNDLERINESLEKNTVNDNGAWDEPPVIPTWRTTTAHKWRGRDFQLVTAPVPNQFAFINGVKYPLSNSASEPAVVSINSVQMTKDKVGDFRQRERDLELSGDFYSIVKRDGFERTAPNRIAFEPKKYLEDHPKRPYHASLKGGLGSLGV